MTLASEAKVAAALIADAKVASQTKLAAETLAAATLAAAADLAAQRLAMSAERDEAARRVHDAVCDAFQIEMRNTVSQLGRDVEAIRNSITSVTWKLLIGMGGVILTLLFKGMIPFEKITGF